MNPPETEFDRLYEATYPRILRTLAAMLGDVAAAEDCTQDAFLRAFRSWHTCKRDAPVEAWLHRIAINVAISYRRKRALREVGELVRRLGRPEQPDPTDQAVGGDHPGVAPVSWTPERLGEMIAREVSDAENETAIPAGVPHRGRAADPVWSEAPIGDRQGHGGVGPDAAQLGTPGGGRRGQPGGADQQREGGVAAAPA
jgi:RNA polymerase sigma-70 factor (ECF subfamily)